MANPRQQPANLDIERQILGAIITDQAAMDKVAPILHPDDFYSPKHQQVYQTALELYTAREAIDATTLGHKLPSISSTINDLTNSARAVENVDSHARIVKNLSNKRAILAVSQELVRMAYDNELTEVQAYAKSVITQILSDDGERSRLLSPADQVEVMRALIERKRMGETTGITSGFPRLDKLTGGLRRGDLIVVGARTSVGKSTYAENIAENAARAGHRALFVSIEMDPEQIAYRFLRRAGASEALVEYGSDDPASTEELERIVQDRLALPLLIHNEPTADTVKIRSMLNQAIAEYGKIDLLVVDYLQLMTDTFGGKVPEHLRLGMITKTLKGMAREYELPVILISQLNRNSDQRGVLPEPRLSDIRESGRIEEDADLILFLWKVEPDMLGNDTKLKIAKNRQGPTGEVPIRFTKPRFFFSEPDDREVELQRRQAEEDAGD
jgi:replicative DNA helicase